MTTLHNVKSVNLDKFEEFEKFECENFSTFINIGPIWKFKKSRQFINFKIVTIKKIRILQLLISTILNIWKIENLINVHFPNFSHKILKVEKIVIFE